MGADRSWKQEFQVSLLALAEAYGMSLTETRVQVYAVALSDLPIEKLKTAMSRAVRELKFFPSAAELRQLVDMSQEDAAVLAWAGLAESASAVGAYGAVDLDVWTAQAVEDVFGSWVEYCETSDGPAMSAKRTEFLAAYRRAKRNLPAGVRRLPGLCDRSDVPALPGRRVVPQLEGRK